MTLLTLYPQAKPEDSITIETASEPALALSEALDLLGIAPKGWQARMIGDTLAGYDSDADGLAADVVVRH